MLLYIQAQILKAMSGLDGMEISSIPNHNNDDICRCSTDQHLTLNGSRQETRWARSSLSISQLSPHQTPRPLELNLCSVVPSNLLYFIIWSEPFPGGFGAVELPAGAFPVSHPGRRWQKRVRGPGNQHLHTHPIFFQPTNFSCLTGWWPDHHIVPKATNGRATNGNGAPSEEIQGKSWYYGPIRYLVPLSILDGWMDVRKKRFNRDILNLKYDGFSVSLHIIGIISQFLCVHAHFMFYQWARFDIIPLY